MYIGDIHTHTHTHIHTHTHTHTHTHSHTRTHTHTNSDTHAHIHTHTHTHTHIHTHTQSSVAQFTPPIYCSTFPSRCTTVPQVPHRTTYTVPFLKLMGMTVWIVGLQTRLVAVPFRS